MPPMKPSANPHVSAAPRQSMHDYWGLFLAEGIALSVLGLAAIIVPPIAGLLASRLFWDGCCHRGDRGAHRRVDGAASSGIWMVAALGGWWR